MQVNNGIPKMMTYIGIVAYFHLELMCLKIKQKWILAIYFRKIIQLIFGKEDLLQMITMY